MVFRGQFFDSQPCQEKLLSGTGAPCFALFAKHGMLQAVTAVTTRNTNRQ
jgi:4-diphosphocytidyl-2C-methyl-D-erythritol kinase